MRAATKYVSFSFVAVMFLLYLTFVKKSKASWSRLRTYCVKYAFIPGGIIQFNCDWYLEGTTPLAQRLEELNIPLVSIQLQMNPLTRQINLVHFQNVYTHYALDHLASEEEKKCLKRLGTFALSQVIQKIHQHLPDSDPWTVKLYACGSIKGRSMERLWELYQDLGFQIDEPPYIVPSPSPFADSTSYSVVPSGMHMTANLTVLSQRITERVKTLYNAEDLKRKEISSSKLYEIVPKPS